MPARTRPIASSRPGVSALSSSDVDADQDDAEQADGHDDGEDPAPIGVGDEKAPERRADDGADQGGDGQPGHGGDEFGLGNGAEQDQAADGDHHGAAEALDDA